MIKRLLRHLRFCIRCLTFCRFRYVCNHFRFSSYTCCHGGSLYCGSYRIHSVLKGVENIE